MSAKRRNGFFRAVFDAYVASRQRQADRFVTGTLLTLDDKTLAERGYSRAELRKRPNSLYI